MYDLPFTRINRLIDEISEQVISDYVKRGLIENINEDGRSHLQKYARKPNHFYQQGKMFNCSRCDHPGSKGFRWRAGCNIPTVCLSKRPGSRGAEDEKQCYAKYDTTVFHKRLTVRANYIYHTLALEFEALEACLQKAYWDRVPLKAAFRISRVGLLHLSS